MNKTKNKGTVIGCSRVGSRKPMKRSTFRGYSKVLTVGKRKSTLRIHSKTSKRAREQAILPLVKILIARIYARCFPSSTVENWLKFELDHILGRDYPGFALGACLDPRNLQLLDHETHEMKTNPPTPYWRDIDLRSPSIKAECAALSGMLVEKAGAAPTLENITRAIREEVKRK